MAKKVELIIGGQYDKKNKGCDSCIERKIQAGGQSVPTVPETIYLVAKEEGKPNPSLYCSPCGVEYLRSLEQHTSFNMDDYSQLHKTPQQLFSEQQQAKITEEERRKELYKKLNN